MPILSKFERESWRDDYLASKYPETVETLKLQFER